MAFSDVKKFFLRWRKELVGLAVLVGLASAVLFILWMLGQITFVEGKVTPVQILTGLLVLAGLFWTSRRVLAAEDNVRVAQEGQITERFTKAIEQLGDEKMAIRLGGIYALERIAKDSGKDHGPIMEVLTAYVREKAPRREEDTQKSAETPPTDIQTILTVIGRRETTGNDRANDRLDLRRTQLAGAYLSEADLSGAFLYRANLVEVNLSGAYLSKADLSGGTTILGGTDLSGALLSEADLRGANLSEIDLSGANLRGADLRGAFLPAADLREAILVKADLRGAKLGIFNVPLTNLSEIILREIDLSEPHLPAADLCGADLREADLCRADLRTTKNLTAKQVRSAKNWREAFLPDHLEYLKDTPEPPA